MQHYATDHRTMAPPSLSVAARRDGEEGGLSALVWDFRLAQPNVARLDVEVVHTIEHALIYFLADWGGAVVHAAPMGCMTGFYIWTLGECTLDELTEGIVFALNRLCEVSAVPMANLKECGAHRHHALAGAQDVARWALLLRDTWSVQNHNVEVPHGDS
jgi:S-ribosylhomocysteine lyase